MEKEKNQFYDKGRMEKEKNQCPREGMFSDSFAKSRGRDEG
jgi:hypothetical protein